MTSNQNRLQGITVWDGVNDLGPANLGWIGDRIDEVVPIAKESERHAGLALIPGLVDTHVHLGGPVTAEEEMAPEPDGWDWRVSSATKTLHLAGHALRAMRQGITTFRETAGDIGHVAVRDAFEQGVLHGPRMFVAGMVSMTAGHGESAMPGSPAGRARVADGPVECRKVVREFARDGVDGIQIAASGTVISRGDPSRWRNYTRGEYNAIVDEAHALGLPVAAHAHTEVGVEIALAEGVDSLQHASLITSEQASRTAELGVPIAPALRLQDRLAEGTLPCSDAAQSKAKELVVRRDQRLRQARQVGVPFVLGTDADGHRLGFDSAYEELVRHREVLGLTDAKALASGTSEAAESLGAGDRVGRIAPGYAADFLVLRSKPWKRIDTLVPENVVAVFCRGRLVAGELP